MKRKTILLISSIVILIILLVSVGCYSIWSYKNKISSCHYLDTSRYGMDFYFHDCFGIISVETWNIPDKHYVIRDDKHDDPIASIQKLNQYRTVSGNIYIYRIPVGSSYSIIDDKKLYPEKFFANEELKTIYYNSVEEIPKFIKVDIDTGEVKFYNNFGEMPNDEKNIFTELVNLSKNL